MLGLLSAGEIADPTIAVQSTDPVVTPATTVREAVDRLIGGAHTVNVVSTEGVSLGGLTLLSVQSAVASTMSEARRGMKVTAGAHS
jgi:hypothetical protein